MIEALLLIIRPVATWERIAQTRHSTAYVLLLYLVPLMVLTSAAEAYGLHQGKWQGEIAHLKQFSINEAIVFEVAQFILTLLIVVLAAKLVKAIGETFHGRHTYNQAFIVVAYGLAPYLLCRALNAFTPMPSWLSWGIGILLSIGALYHGLPRVLAPDPPHAFGLYFMTSLLLLLITGMAQFVTAWYWLGKFNKLDSIVAELARRLPF